LPTLPKGTIEIENLWKRFRADRALPELTEHLKLIGRRLKGGDRDWRWVLRDVNLRVEPGRTQAIVGVNGSGKSTLLKMMCQTTFPSAGRVEVEGRIGALLEVKSGIHPDLTGRENIFLFGNILGMSRREVARRFDDIVEFGEVSQAIDRQVKFYSAGMSVRLGFAIAIFLDPDILLVDEVLAVGDAHFQQKCLRRIAEVVANGTTLVFVSHDLATVEAVCESAMWLADSYVQATGPTREVLGLYRASVEEQAALTPAKDGDLRVLKVEVSSPDGEQITSGEELNLRFLLRSAEPNLVSFFVGVSEGTSTPVFLERKDGNVPGGDFELRCRLRHLPVPKGRYSVWVGAWGHTRTRKEMLPWQPVASFQSFGPDHLPPPPGVTLLSPVYVAADWELN
jgi:ABC-type polysaccharide/polyol phosphate transport system ATPase subunit